MAKTSEIYLSSVPNQQYSATDEDDFIVIDGVKYERETAEGDPRTQVPPAPNESETQKERKIIEYDPNTGEPIYE